MREPVARRVPDQGDEWIRPAKRKELQYQENALGSWRIHSLAEQIFRYEPPHYTRLGAAGSTNGLVTFADSVSIPRRNLHHEVLGPIRDSLAGQTAFKCQPWRVRKLVVFRIAHVRQG